ncbi:MAG: alpha/beta hydrolase [Mycolicibacterium fortuitum]
MVECDELAGVAVERIIPTTARPATALLYFHGGGYTLGSARGYRGFAGTLASAAAMEVVTVDYRLAPEHPFPAALDDAFAAYRALTERVATVAVAGDSAGGGLTLALVQRIRESSLPAPAALGLICPWLDLAPDQLAVRPATNDPALLPSLVTEWCRNYVGTGDARQAGVSPVYGDLSSLPPIVMHSAGDDLIAGDADKFERAIASQSTGGLLIHRRFSNRWHDFHLQVGLLADADDAVTQFGRQLADLVAVSSRARNEDQPAR